MFLLERSHHLALATLSRPFFHPSGKSKDVREQLKRGITADGNGVRPNVKVSTGQKFGGVKHSLSAMGRKEGLKQKTKKKVEKHKTLESGKEPKYPIWSFMGSTEGKMHWQEKLSKAF
ncbi:hypothetical protein RUM44_004598 [Polyplax serrata]|uniref:Uncharacterized protein n=1 Tax=Polyplax serrata TaxID=468196 RepID=A0ABR1B415_POLSC